ncbi:MAG: glycerate kinase [Clostridiales bacterium]|nr:glycerate kinase [Clostridiales bacterium]
MKKILLVPDSFKGTMSSTEICSIMKEALLKAWPEAEIISIPVADGGEGSVDAFLTAVGGQRVSVPCQGPYGEAMEGFYGLLPDGTAVVEMAAAAGLPLVGENRQAHKTTTYGVGQLILAAAQAGAKKIIVGLGGSATNDGGAGTAAALGVRFLNSDGEAFVPVGGTLDQVASIDGSALSPALQGVEIVTMCDIDNPLCGPTGASAVFGPQKGADEATVALLDKNLAHLADVVARDLGRECRNIPGAGAAGGMGFGMAAFLQSRLQPGIETVLDTVRFDDLARDADLIFTGEGKIDSQSLRGKVVIGVGRRAKPLGVPVVAVVGDIGDGVEGAYEEGICGIFSINRLAIPFSESRFRSPADMRLTMENLAVFLKRLGH